MRRLFIAFFSHGTTSGKMLITTRLVSQPSPNESGANDGSNHRSLLLLLALSILADGPRALFPVLRGSEFLSTYYTGIPALYSRCSSTPSPNNRAIIKDLSLPGEEKWPSYPFRQQ